MKSLEFFCCSFAMCVGFGPGAPADFTPIPAEPLSEAEESAMVNYLEEIDLRAANSEALAVQPLAVAQALDSVSGQTLLEMSWGTLSWNSAIENVEIRQNDEPVSLSYYVDEYGRPAFVGEKVQGVIEVFGSQAYLKITANGDTSFWLDEFTTTVDENGQVATSLSFLAKKKCVCKGSNGTGLNNACSSDVDCRNRNTCTYRNDSGDHPSQCGFYYVPLHVTEVSGEE